MITVREDIRAMERAQRARGATPGRFTKFYSSRAWRRARYEFLKRQPRPLRCACCGATTADTRLAVDHIEPIKKNWERRLDQTNFQLLCAGNDGCAGNLAKGSRDQTDWREPRT